MKHDNPSRAWRPSRTRTGLRAHGVLGALVFNVCLLLAPLAAGAAYVIIARDNLYAYEYSPAGARVVAARVERLNGELIQLDFDRQRQWDNLVAMELMADDVASARGFLLSARGMLPARIADQLNRSLIRNASDSEIELAALALLSPGTRARYESTMPPPSRSAAAQANAAARPPDREDFDLMARALLAQPETDALQFVLTGLRLGLAGDLGPRAGLGAAALIDASRRDDYPLGLEADVNALLAEAAPVLAFHDAALASAQGGDAGASANLAAAFQAAAKPVALARARAMLDQIGAMSEAASHDGAVALLTHASGLRDLPKLQLIAESAGDRAAAAAKRLQRDGRLLGAARGELTMTRELAAAIAVAALSLLGALALVLVKAYQFGLAWWARWRDEDYAGDLVEISATNWRSL